MFTGAHTIQPGLPVADLETPTLVVDLDAMDRNIARMAQFARQAGVRWRPHAKMHKCAALALRLIAAGATGCCVQKLAEAEALAAGGVRDIYISNEIVDARKLRRVAQLAAQLESQAEGGRLAIAVDSAEGVQRLADAMESTPDTTIDVYIEIDIGQNRAGLTDDDAVLALAHTLAAQPRLRFAGLHAYHGGAQHVEDAAARTATMAAAHARVRQALQRLREAGFEALEVTGAGTGTFALEAASGLYTELQPGSFLFMDAHYARVAPSAGQPVFEHALFVKTQVIACAGEHVVVDAGHKSHAIDSGLPLVWNHGQAPRHTFANGGDEHGIVRLADAVVDAVTDTPLPALGETLWLVPGHCDPTVNLHEALIGVRGGLAAGVVENVLRVDARGALW